MPDFTCDKGHKWEVLLTIAHDPADMERCPTCGGEAQKVFSMPAQRVYTQFLDPLEQADLMANKRDIEANSDKVRSGEWTVRERGPREFRPQPPDKRFY